jgi:hypothetical protein
MVVPTIDNAPSRVQCSWRQCYAGRGLKAIDKGRIARLELKPEPSVAAFVMAALAAMGQPRAILRVRPQCKPALTSVKTFELSQLSLTLVQIQRLPVVERIVPAPLSFMESKLLFK